MKKLLVCQHVAFEILGTLDPLLRSAGFRIRYVNFSREPDAQPQFDLYHGLVVLGGPMCLDEVDSYPHLSTELDLIRDAIRNDVPVLGVCLGAQLLARALGAGVGRNSEKEIGWYDVSVTDEGRNDPLFAHFRDTEKIFQWHGDTFEIPDGAVHLATSPTCSNQAFRYGDSAYGFQFHLEVDEPLIERWLSVPIHVAELAELEGRIDPEAIRRQTPENIARLGELSRGTFGAFIEMLGQRRRHQVLSSR